MKIAVISPNPANLRDMAAVLTGLSHRVITVEGGKGKMSTLAEQEKPDLMLVEGMCCDTAELLQVEAVTSAWPEMAVVLLCPTHTPEFLIQSMRAGVRDIMPSPAPAQALAAMASRVEAKLKGAGNRGGAKVLAFLPCKGGSGATFLAANLGFHLAESASVLLVDLNLQFGDALSVLHDGRPACNLADVAQGISRLDATFLAASAVQVAPNYSILPAPEDPSQAVAVKPEHVDAILGMAVAQYDFVLIDLPRSIDPITVRALDRAQRIYPVMQLNLPALRNARQLLTTFGALGYFNEKVEVILNRADKSASVGIDDVRRSLGNVALRTVPNAFKEVSASIDQGVALATLARNNPVARTLADLGDSLRPRSPAARGFLDRILKRA